MVKHCPGGRDGHFGCGANALYPAKNLKDHLQSFTENSFKFERGNQ